MRKYRFFYHYNKKMGGMTIHFRKECIPVQHIECDVPCETHWQKQQPRLVMRGFAKEVILDTKTKKAYIR